MSHDLVLLLKKELNALAFPDYRASQGVHANPKGLKRLRRLLDLTKNLDEQSIVGFSRCVSDVAPTTSELSRLTEELYRSIVKQKIDS